MEQRIGLRYPWDAPPEHGVPQEVAPGLHWLRLPLPMKLDHVNCWLLEDAAGLCLVDTGFASRLTRELWEKALDGRRVARVIVTHHHPDHVGLAGWFQSEHGADLSMPRTGWLMARMLRLDEQDRPAPETVAFWRGVGMDEDVLTKRMTERPFNFADVVAPMPLGFTRLVEGGRLTIGGRRWTVRMGGGHAPEHATLWSDDGLVLGGDQLLPSISPNIGVYATEPEADPLSDWLEACERLAGFATADQLVLPGHKLPFTGLPLRLKQLVENHHGALARLEAHLSTPRSAAECFAPLFKRRIGAAEYGLALVEAMAHCLHLWHAGRVTRTRNDHGAFLFHTATAKP